MMGVRNETHPSELQDGQNDEELGGRTLCLCSRLNQASVQGLHRGPCEIGIAIGSLPAEGCRKQQ